MKVSGGFAICTLIIFLHVFEARGQDKAFLQQLQNSRHLKTVMQPDSATMGFVRWKNKKATQSKVIALVSDFNDLKLKGPGTLKIEKQISVSGNGSVLLETPTSLSVKNPSNRSYAFAEMIRPLNNEDLNGYNRITAWVKLDAPGFYSAFVGVTLYNDGKNKMPTPGRFEGQHFITVYPGQWQQIIWEIPDLYRDKVSGISISIMLGGSPSGASDHFKLYIDALKIEKVVPENSRGFDLREGGIAYSHSGYVSNSRKQALIQHVTDTHFQIINDQGQVAFSGSGKSLEKGFALLDFSSLDKPGQYKIKVGGILSGAFPIGDKAYLSASWRTLNFFFAERCGFDQPGIHQACHKDVRCVHPDGRQILVNGGWHDAADLTLGLGNSARAVIAMLQLARSVKDSQPELYTRIKEEARWGLDWILNTRFGDGYRHGGLIIGIWTDNIIGTKDDMEAKASNNPFDNFISSVALAMAVPFYEKEDVVFSTQCRNAASEDFAFATDMMGQFVNQKNETELHSLATVAATILYQLTHEKKYLDRGVELANVLMACQDTERHKEWSIPLHGFFYESRDRKRPLAFFHRSDEEFLIQGFVQLLEMAPKHPDASKWMEACKFYADYIHDISKVVGPYEILPAAVYQINNADFEGIYHEGDKIGMPSLEEYNAQVKNGIPLGGDYYLRRFPVAYQFRGFHAVLMGKAKAAFLLSALLKDNELRNIATRQFEYIVGYNPFAMSTIYGEGYDYPPLYGAYVGDAVGAVPVGIETFENDDEPYLPMQVNATYKEVWIHTTASAIWIIAQILSRF